MTNSVWNRLKQFWFIYPFIALWLLKPVTPNWGVIPPKSCMGGCGSIEGMIPFVEWVNNLIDLFK